MEGSLFGRLSGELRNRIYELALREGDELMDTIDLEQGWFDCPFHRSKVMDSARTGFVEPLQPLRLTSLPFTCKAIRKESLRLYYSLNSFTFETEYLKSKHKTRIIERLVEWVKRIGVDQASEMRDITIGLASLKGTAVAPEIDWHHMRLIRGLFHPTAQVKISFYLDGNGTATFVLGEKQDMAEQLRQMAEVWCLTYQRVRKYDLVSATLLAERYRSEVARLFEGMPKMV